MCIYSSCRFSFLTILPILFQTQIWFCFSFFIIISNNQASREVIEYMVVYYYLFIFLQQFMQKTWVNQFLSSLNKCFNYSWMSSQGWLNVCDSSSIACHRFASLSILNTLLTEDVTLIKIAKCLIRFWSTQNMHRIEISGYPLLRMLFSNYNFTFTAAVQTLTQISPFNPISSLFFFP